MQICQSQQPSFNLEQKCQNIRLGELKEEFPNLQNQPRTFTDKKGIKFEEKGQEFLGAYFSATKCLGIHMDDVEKHEYYKNLLIQNGITPCHYPPELTDPYHMLLCIITLHEGNLKRKIIQDVVETFQNKIKTRKTLLFCSTKHTYQFMYGDENTLNIKFINNDVSYSFHTQETLVNFLQSYIRFWTPSGDQLLSLVS